jgi:hypothetical protein
LDRLRDCLGWAGAFDCRCGAQLAQVAKFLPHRNTIVTQGHLTPFCFEIRCLRHRILRNSHPNQPLDRGSGRDSVANNVELFQASFLVSLPVTRLNASGYITVD